MLDTGTIAVLWIIREQQPITVEAIDRYITIEGEKNQLPFLTALAGRKPSSHRSRGCESDVLELIKAGLVRVEDGSKFSPTAKLTVEPRLWLIQGLFDLSLTEILKHNQKGIEAYPMFGAPLELSKVWARIFVAMPFLDKLKPIYSEHILKVAGELDVSCKRGDDFSNSHRIMDDVWSSIYHADLCIVDCTKRNPNVFYELGIAHTLGRKTILIAQTIKDIPFDIQGIRTIIYEYTPPGMKQFEESLAKTIRQELGLSE